MSEGSIHQILSQPYACGWKDGAGPLRLAWGTDPHSEKKSLGLRFRNFFHPESQDPEIWKAFPNSGECAPENFLSLPNFTAGALAPMLLGEPAQSPNQKGWLAFCEKIAATFAKEEIKKIVPARRQDFTLSAELHARLKRELLPRLFSGPQDGTFRFFLKWQDNWFFGATPEMLFRRQGNKWLIPAIAGTRALANNEKSSIVEEELFSNKKERAEHELVVRGIKETLGALGLDPNSPSEPTILRIRGLIHLYTPVTADFGGIKSEQLLNALHPTAAVGGYPTEAAQKFLLENEPWNRGLFASPLLFTGPEEDVCLVGIRSGLLTPETLHLFAGAGYVNGSSAEAEWAETGKKMDFLQRLLEEERP